MRQRVSVGLSAIMVLFITGCEIINYSQKLPGPFVVTPEFQEISLTRPLIVYRYFNDLCYHPMKRGLSNSEIPSMEVEITYDDQSVVNFTKFRVWGERVCLSMANFKSPSKIIRLRVRSSSAVTISSFEWLTSDKAN